MPSNDFLIQAAADEIIHYYLFLILLKQINQKFLTLLILLDIKRDLNSVKLFVA